MSIDSRALPSVATPTLPRSIWVVAWASLAGQAVLLLQRGVRGDDDVSVVVSVVLGAALVGYVSAGVVRARTVRLGIAWVLLVLSVVAELVALVLADGPAQATRALLLLASSGVSLAGLAIFRRTDWYAWQRTRPSTSAGARIGRLVAVGVLVGALGGIIGGADVGGVETVRS